MTGHYRHFLPISNYFWNHKKIVLTTIFSKWGVAWPSPWAGSAPGTPGHGTGCPPPHTPAGGTWCQGTSPWSPPSPPSLCVDPQGQQVRRLLPREVFEASPKATLSCGSTQCYNLEEKLTTTWILLPYCKIKILSSSPKGGVKKKHGFYPHFVDKRFTPPPPLIHIGGFYNNIIK